jgi:hypothetical protein
VIAVDKAINALEIKQSTFSTILRIDFTTESKFVKAF